MTNRSDQPLYIGIDLGTSNTEITVLQNDTVETLAVTQNRTANGGSVYGFKRLPSLVCFAEDGTPMFGEVYRKPTTDLTNYTGRVVFNTKRMLLERPETKAYHIRRNDGTVDMYSPQDIATLLLKRCAEEAKRQKNYQPSDHVMITVPCGYQMDQIQATIRAARNAGFRIDEDVELITEPVAALIEYIQCQSAKYPPDDPRHIDPNVPQNILVYDLGGGTLDLSVVRIEKTDDVFHFTELANNDSERDRTIGGADFDTAVAEYLRKYLLEYAARERNCTPEDIRARLPESNFLNDDTMLELMHSRAYDMKHFLARRPAEVSPIVFYSEQDNVLDFDPVYISLDGGTVNGLESICYLDIVRDFLTAGTPRNILDPIPSVLNSAILDGCKLPVSQINKILITGGMCKFQAVRDTLMRYLDELANDPENPIRLHVLESDAGLEAVSIGAAYSHKLKIENHNEYQSKHYYLDVADGLPQDLVSRGIYRPITLLNPKEALFEIYCGTSFSDPDMRRQYYYHKRFDPPLSGSADITFFLDRKKTGEANLIGTIIHSNNEREEIVFVEQNAAVLDEPAAPVYTAPALEPGYSAIMDFLHNDNNTDTQTGNRRSIVYQGNKKVIQDAPEGTDKRLFLNSTSNHDSSVSSTFSEILHLMDLKDELGTRTSCAGLAMDIRFNRLMDILMNYYQSEPDERRIPVFQYALYSMHQLPLGKMAPPSFPKGNENTALRNDYLRDISEEIRIFCEDIGYLLVDPDLHPVRKEQLEAELNHCITEWRWQDLFQLCISIAQVAGSTKLAEALQRRLLRRTRALERHQPDSMEKPHFRTQERLAQIYWNAIKDNELSAADIRNLDMLLHGHFCDMDYSWIGSDAFAQEFSRLSTQVRDQLIRGNPALQKLKKDKTISLDEVSSPDQLLNKSFKDAHRNDNQDLRPRYWKKVNEFLNNPETTWKMVHVLSKRGRGFDDAVKAKLPTLTPGNSSDRRAWIRTLGCCRTTEARNKLLDLWKTCCLKTMTNSVNPSAREKEIYTASMNAARKWLENPAVVKNMTTDHSFEILAALCMGAKKNQLSFYQHLMSCAVATVPSAWISSQGDYGAYWRAISDAMLSLWNNLSRRDHTDYRLSLTNSLYQLCRNAYNHYPTGVAQFDQALFNFCKLFSLDRTLQDMYHCSLGKDMLQLFARSIQAGDGCPLSPPCQKQFLDFLNRKHKSNDMDSLKDKYSLMLVLWYQNTDKLGQMQLLYSEAFQNLVGPTPTTTRVTLQDIIDGRF